MDEKISLHLKYTSDDYIRVCNFVESQKLLSQYGYIAFPVALIFILALIAFQIGDSRVFYYGFLPAISGGLSIFGIYKILTPLMIKRGATRQIKRNADQTEVTKIVFSEEGIERENRMTKDLTKWESYVAATESADDFFFYIDEIHSEFIPKRAFYSPEDLERARRLVRSKLGDLEKR